MMDGRKVMAIVPAYNTARTIGRTLAAIPRPLVDAVIVVDDGSADDTAAIAERLGALVCKHPQNRGYGAAQKTAYREALRQGADVAVMIHADFQYDPSLVPAMVRPLVSGSADACFGSRMVRKRDARRGGMPWWRFIANIALTFVEERVFRLYLSEYHTGYRAYTRGVLVRLPFERNSDNYVFDTEMIAQLRAGNFRVAEIAIPTRYSEDSCSPNFWKSVQYGFSTLMVLGKYILHRFRLRSFPQFIIGITRE
jgi:glycosyltransferase involved in cell wall biosynthesis